jgi:exodeoxyribonuclease-3
MKIASFNINNINRRLSNLLDWLREAEPDIVCLQELKVADSEFPAEAIRQAGYHAVYRGETSWNGVATGVAFPSLPLVIPEGVHRLFGMERANGVGPALREKVLIHCAALGLQKGVKLPRLRWVDVEICRHNIVISPHDHRCPSRVEFSRVGVQALQPSEFVIEFWTGLRVSVGSVDRRDEHAVDGRFEIAALPIAVVAWQVHASDHGNPLRKDLRLDHILLSPTMSERLQGAGVDRQTRGMEGASDHAPPNLRRNMLRLSTRKCCVVSQALRRL